MVQLIAINDEQQPVDTHGTAVEAFATWHESHGQALQTDRYRALMPTSAPGPGQQYAFEVSLDTCSGCKACVTACHSLNGLEPNETWRKVGQLASLNARLPIVQHVTTACHHCAEPGCLAGCPVKAYEKDPLDGIVRHLDDQCFGCKYCIMMCPYEVPQYSHSMGIVRKCDMCSQRMSAGEAPACVQACPNSAIRITLVDQKEVVRQTSQVDESLVPTAPLSSITHPTTQYIGKVNGLANGLRSVQASELRPEHSHWPLVFMLVFTQASVGLWTAACFRSSTSLTNYFPHYISLITAFFLAISGVHVALLHLGRPWLAFRGFLGWRTSWLSREVIAFTVYLVVAGIAVSIHAITDNQLIGSIACWIACSCGWIAVACSGMVYIATRRVLWAWQRTGVEFAMTTMSLGLALSATLDVSSIWTSVWLFALAFLAGTAALIPKWFDWRLSQDWLNSTISPAQVPHESFQSGRLLSENFGVTWRMIWLLFASLSLCLVAYGRWVLLVSDETTIPNGMHYLSSFICLTLSWILLQVRRLSFATVVYPRMPGAVV